MTGLLVAAAVTMVVAGALHGLSGTGFALIATPMLTLLLGAHEGLRVGLIAALSVCVFALIGMWREVEWRRAALLALGGLVTAPLGYLVFRMLPPAVLLITIGAMVLLMLVVGVVSRRPAAGASRAGLVATGAVAGVIHVTSALSAPVFTAYALRTRWSPTAFTATVQVVFISFNALSIALWGPPAMGPCSLALLLAAILCGLLGGLALRRRASERVVLAVTTTVAVLAGIAAIVRGALEAGAAG
ncbi:TSUP family transporter [Microbacterium sp.]|uniref:TSUP family transporter n=1 Tax=Microbacterium sp. TaxID=51671 RepID=UPI00092C6414|nr:TSUP family transporter [Microbacterium sp.]MBN9193804.1 TSUP family transporter [Microbacterium sp.]OJU66276.1 MAG: hypothetical protein BGO04_13770 [Microbacterium sp. 70-38]